MSQLAVSGVSNTAPSSGGDAGLRGLEIDDFLDLMIAELQNQDPLNPLDNAQMLQQISQIREIGATDRLTETLESIAFGQKLSGASSLIGKEIVGRGADGERVEGVVDRLSFIDGEPTLHVGDARVALQDVQEVKTPAGDQSAD